MGLIELTVLDFGAVPSFESPCVVTWERCGGVCEDHTRVARVDVAVVGTAFWDGHRSMCGGCQQRVVLVV
eukprot:4170917-Amphidinium_carterae.1